MLERKPKHFKGGYKADYKMYKLQKKFTWFDSEMM